MARFARLLAAAGTMVVACLPAVAVDLFNNTNTGAVENGAKPPTFLNGSTSHIGQIETYHWNNGRGATPGTITLKSANGQTFGPYKATGSSGQGNAPNVNWYVNVDITIPLGTYEIIDSDPATWSQNAQTRGIGFAIVRGDRVAPQAAPPAPAAQSTGSLPPSPVAMPGAAQVKPLPPSAVSTVKVPTAPVPAPAPAASASGVAAGELFNNTNTGAVQNGAKGEVLLITYSPVHISQLQTYHWNNGSGARPGTLSLKNASGFPVYGPFAAQGVAGTNNVQNVNWVANVNLDLPAGTYQLVDSDPSTWSQNAQSHNIGFAIIRGAHVAAAGAPAPAPTGGTVPPAPGTVPLAPKPSVLPGAVPAGGAPSGGGSYTPCMSNAGAIATMSPCSGGPGTRITIKLNRNLNAPLKEITFRPYQVTGIPGGVGALVLAPVSGNSKTAGSYYEVTVPQQLCVGKGGSWDLFPTDTSNQGQGDIGRFTVQCGAGAVAGGSGAPAPTTLAPPPPPSPAPFKPCYVNSGSVAAISPCTTIRPGDIVTIQVLQALKSPIKTVVFKPRQLSLPSATGVDVQVTMTSSATNVGGTYNFPLPQQICLSGRGSWDAWPVDGNGKGLGDIGQVNVVCQ